MYFNPIQLAIFKNLLRQKQYRLKNNSSLRGRPVIKDITSIFKSIIYKVKSGTKWEDIQRYGDTKYSPSTVYKYFKHWCNNGLFEDIYKHVLKVYSRMKRIRWKYQSIDSTIIKAFRGGQVIGKNSTDRGRMGTKVHTLADKNGIPLGFIVTEANYHDSNSVAQLLNCYKLKRPKYVQHMNLDTAYDAERIRTRLHEHQFQHHIPKNKRNSRVSPQPMSAEEKFHYRNRITIEHQFGHLKQYRSIIIRYARLKLHFENLINIAYSRLISNKL